MSYRIFISSVQREFAKERKAIADMIRKDMLLGTFFDVFMFERTAAQNRSAQSVYIGEVRDCDIYLGIFGDEYGFEDSKGVSPTEREYDKATELGKFRLVFIKRSASARAAKERAFIAKVQVMLFRDRLEIINPGTLPRGWTAANLLRTHDSKPHNGILATAMQWAGYVEKSGYGTEDIVRKCKAWGLREPEYHPSAVDFRLVLWRQENKDSRDFTQLGEVGEVGSARGVESSTARGVESNAKTPIKSRARGESARLHSTPQKGVESGGGVVHSLRDMILLSVMQQPKSRAEIARSLGKPRIFGNLVCRITTLLDDDLIELTVPDKPNSRLQKYRITKKGRQVAKLIAENHAPVPASKKGDS